MQETMQELTKEYLFLFNTITRTQQELQRLKQEEKELLVYLLALDIDKIALKIDCSVSNVYRKRRRLSNKLEGLKG